MTEGDEASARQVHLVEGEPAVDRRAAQALLPRRAALGLPGAPQAAVLVDHEGRGYAAAEVPMALRRARSTRISIDGNAHFCRGLLRTRYGDEVVEVAGRALIPLTVKEAH